METPLPMVASELWNTLLVELEHQFLHDKAKELMTWLNSLPVRLECLESYMLFTESSSPKSEHSKSSGSGCGPPWSELYQASYWDFWKLYHMLDRQPLFVFCLNVAGTSLAAFQLSNQWLRMQDSTLVNAYRLTRSRRTFQLLVPDIYDELFCRWAPVQCYPNRALANSVRKSVTGKESVAGSQE